jgi:hypothetical protein
MDERRFGILEGRVEEHSNNWDRLSGELGLLSGRIDAVGARIDALDMKLSVRFEIRFDALDRKIDDLRAELATQFRWTIGI